MSKYPPTRSPEPSTAHPASTRSTRSQHTSGSGQGSGFPPRRGLPPISTGGTGHIGASSTSQSPSRRAFSPTSFAFNQASIAANRQVSRQSSTSSSHSLTSPSGSAHYAPGSLHSGQRSRAPTLTGSPRLASSFASLSSLSQGASGSAGGGGGSSRLARHSPSISSSTLGSPTSSTGGGSSGQLTSLVITQLNILLSTIKENNFDIQAEKIRRLLDENGMELYETYFRRLLHSSWSLVFPNDGRPGANNAESHQLLVQELDKLSTDPQQAEKVAQALDASEAHDFNYAAFVDHFRLAPFPKTALLVASRIVARPDQRRKGKALSSVVRSVRGLTRLPS